MGSELELSQVRQEIERRIAEKEEEFASTKKNFGKAVDSMQGALEKESKEKAEGLRMKKKLRLIVLNWTLLLNMPILLMLKPKRLSRSIINKSERFKANLKRNREPSKVTGKLFWPMKGGLTLPRTA